MRRSEKTGVFHENVLRIFQICAFSALDIAPTLDVPILRIIITNCAIFATIGLNLLQIKPNIRNIRVEL